MSEKEYLSIPLEDFELKAGTDGWAFTAYSSTFGNKDHGGDVISAGAFDATLRSRAWRPLLWQHDMREPIGIEKSLQPDRKGLLGTWEIIDTQRGQDAYKLLKRGAVRSMSIGYIPNTYEFADEGTTRILKSVELLENSVVSIPMNEMARVQSVKHDLTIDDDVPFEKLLAQIKAAVQRGADEAEALTARRAEDQRKLTDAHIDALVLLNEELKGSTQRIEALLSQSRDGQLKGDTSVRRALEFARRRSRALGIEREQSSEHDSSRGGKGNP